MKNTDIGQHLQITILPWYSFQLFADYKSVMVGTCLLGEMQFGLWSATKLSSIQIFIAHIIRKTPQDILNKIESGRSLGLGPEVFSQDKLMKAQKMQ